MPFIEQNIISRGDKGAPQCSQRSKNRHGAPLSLVARLVPLILSTVHFAFAARHMMLANIAASLGVSCSWKMAAGCLGVRTEGLRASLFRTCACVHDSWASRLACTFVLGSLFESFPGAAAAFSHTP